MKIKGEKQLKKLKNTNESKTLKAIDKIRRENDETNKLRASINRTLDKAELVCTKTDESNYDFNCFALPLKFIEKKS